MAYADGLPPPEAFDRYYAEMSQWEFLANQGVEPPMDRMRFDRVAGYFVEAGLDRETQVVDVGCATGGLLAAFKRRGFQRLRGLDPSPRCAELAWSNYGIPVSVGTVGRLDRLGLTAGLVTLSGVLEHLYDPRPPLESIRQMLADGGLLYVNVPDASRFAQHLDGPYQQFSIEHIQYFTPDSLVNLMKGLGFDPVRIIASAQPYSLTYQYPGIEGIFKKAAPSPWRKDESSEPALRAYLQASAALDEKVERQMERLAGSREPLLVWGVGTNTQRLMASGPLGRANITAFVDSNPHYHGKTLCGRPVLPPSRLSEHGESVLVASFIFRKEIAEQIRNALGCSNHLIFLGDEA